jgi:sialidase-1
MSKIEVIDSHIIYENPKPHVHSRHGFFPGLTRLPSGDFLTLFVRSEAFESPDATTYVSRSTDGARTWTLEGPLYDKSHVGFETSDSFKPTLLRDGSLVAMGYRFHRFDPESGIGLEETDGILPGDDLITFSTDEGRSWSFPSVIARTRPELLEISGPCIELRSGDLVAVAGIFSLPDGTNPSGQGGVVLRSSDSGQTWDDKVSFFESPSKNITAWESRICEMEEGRLVVIFWAYDIASNTHLPNQIVVSHDDGRTWSNPINTAHRGQAPNLIYLGDDHLLTIQCHRQEESAIYVRLVDFRNDSWKVCVEKVIWGTSKNEGNTDGEKTVKMFKSLNFGQPSLLLLSGDEVLATHWSVEDGQGRIRSHRLHLEI